MKYPYIPTIASRFFFSRKSVLLLGLYVKGVDNAAVSAIKAYFVAVKVKASDLVRFLLT
jgi:hypothetical protein